ncbi:MAG TPA: HAD-IA family hydrolase [Candidatus Dormibacteraeota bacterium]
MFRAIVFDFDGLILETEQPIYQSWLEVYRAHGEELPYERWIQTVGSTNATFHPQHHLEERLGRALTQEVLENRIARRTALILQNAVLPGVVDLIEAARRRGMEVGVASSSACDWVRGHLLRLGILHRFDCIRCRDDVAHAKPEPDLYLSVLDCLGVRASEAFAVEDSPNGITAAKRAGMKCLAVPNPITERLDLSHADAVVRSLADVNLDEVMERLQP